MFVDCVLIIAKFNKLMVYKNGILLVRRLLIIFIISST